MSKNTNKELCHYGCGQLGVKKQQNGFWICTDKTWHACPAHRKRMKKSALNRAPLFELRKNIAAGKAVCYICGFKARYLVKKGRACCKPNAMKCSGYNKYMGDIHKESYRSGGRIPIYEGKKRPNHSKRLLKLNKFGKLGGYNFYHQKARDLYYTGLCSMCGKNKKEEMEYWNKDLTMHCKSGDWTDLSKDNWETICYVHHRHVHSKKFKEAQNG